MGGGELGRHNSSALVLLLALFPAMLEALLLFVVSALARIVLALLGGSLPLLGKPKLRQADTDENKESS